MKINQLAARPQLIAITLDDEDTIAEYGEPIEFWTWDRQPLDVFMRLARVDGNDIGDMIEIIRTLVLDESGNPVISDEAMLPTPVLIRVMNKVVTVLGK